MHIYTYCICKRVMSLISHGFTSAICSQTISSLKDEIRELKQKIQNQDSAVSSHTLENQELQEHLDLQRRYSDILRIPTFQALFHAVLRNKNADLTFSICLVL